MKAGKAERFCRQCGKPLGQEAPRGRPRRYCSPLCQGNAAFARAFRRRVEEARGTRSNLLDSDLLDLGFDADLG